jgi:hypothetical protein
MIPDAAEVQKHSHRMKVDMLQKTILKTAIQICVSGLAAVMLIQTAYAEEPKFVEEFNDWSVYSYKSGGGTVCYIVSEPKDSEPKNVRRDKVFFLVQNRPKDKVKSEVSTIIGYKFKEGSNVTLDIDGAKHQLYTIGDGAWADTSALDKKIVAAMKAGKSMVVSGTSWRGTKTTDRYSLAGVTAAMQKIDNMCN